MSSVSVSYGSLKDASGEAKAVARKLNDYANSIEKTVYNKLNKYSGSWTNSIYTARNNANTKMSTLRTQADRFTTYANNLIDLRDECKRVDKAVRSKVSSLTAAFKEAHGIRNSKIENAISYFFTSIGNSTGFGRWLGDKADLFKSGTNYLKDSIKEWYNYDGGKELIKGALVALLEIAIAVCTLIAGGGILAMIAAAIALANGVVNLINEFRAYNAAQNNDPATARRLSSEDSIQDFLRDGDITDENGGGFLGVNDHVKTSRLIAAGIDVVNLVCVVGSIIQSCGKLLKNGYKWATGDLADLKDIKMKDVLSKDSFKQFFGKLKTTFGQGFKELGAALKRKDFMFFLKGIKDFGSDFLNNLKGEFAEFDSLKHGASSTKHILGVVKVITKDGLFTQEGIKGLVEKIVIPSISITELASIKFPEGGGQGSFEFDNVTIDDFYKIFDDLNKKVIGSDLFSQGFDVNINLDVLNKLSTNTSINISIPEIYVPDISMPAMAA